MTLESPLRKSWDRLLSASAANAEEPLLGDGRYLRGNWIRQMTMGLVVSMLSGSALAQIFVDPDEFPSVFIRAESDADVEESNSRVTPNHWASGVHTVDAGCTQPNSNACTGTDNGTARASIDLNHGALRTYAYSPAGNFSRGWADVRGLLTVAGPTPTAPVTLELSLDGILARPDHTLTSVDDNTARAKLEIILQVDGLLDEVEEDDLGLGILLLKSRTATHGIVTTGEERRRVFATNPGYAGPFTATFAGLEDVSSTTSSDNGQVVQIPANSVVPKPSITVTVPTGVAFPVVLRVISETVCSGLQGEQHCAALSDFSNTVFANASVPAGYTLSVNAAGFQFNGAASAPGAGSPGTLQFAAPSFGVGENVGSATLTVVRTGGSAGSISVAASTSSAGNASAGSDFTAVSTTLSFADGETSKTLTIPILNDAVSESDETVVVALTNPGGGASLGGQASTALTISDDDTSGSHDSGGGCAIGAGGPEATLPLLLLVAIGWCFRAHVSGRVRPAS